jgi:hypothetical protein
VAGQVFNVQAARGIFDAQKAIELQVAEHNASIEVAALTKQLTANQQAESVAQSKLQTAFQTAVNNYDASLSTATGIAGQFGGSVASAMSAISAGIKTYTASLGTYSQDLSQYGAQLLGGTVPGASYPSTRDTLGGTSGGQHAAGAVGIATGPTRMLIGEAGAETYAILRNPRSVATGGGGNVYVTVQMSGSYVDRAQIKRDVQTAVEEGIRRKGQLLGLRNPAA